MDEGVGNAFGDERHAAAANKAALAVDVDLDFAFEHKGQFVGFAPGTGLLPLITS